MLEYRLARATAAATFALLVIGGMVHATGSSLACPDWPLCYGQFFPAMEGGRPVRARPPAGGPRRLGAHRRARRDGLAASAGGGRSRGLARRRGAGALPGLARRPHRGLEAAARGLVGPPRHLDGLLLGAGLALLAPRALRGRRREPPPPRAASARWPGWPHSACTSRSSSGRWCATPAPASPAARAWCSARAPLWPSPVARPSSSRSTGSPAWRWRRPGRLRPPSPRCAPGLPGRAAPRASPPALVRRPDPPRRLDRLEPRLGLRWSACTWPAAPCSSPTPSSSSSSSVPARPRSAPGADRLPGLAAAAG